MHPALRHKYYYSNSSSYSSEVQALIDQATADEVQQPNSVRLTALDDFITTLKTYSVRDLWAVLDWFAMFTCNDTNADAFSTYNLKSPSTHRLTDVVAAATYLTTGRQWDGATSNGSTNFNPSTDGVKYLQDSASRIMYIEAAPTVGVVLDGIDGASANILQYSSTTSQRINSGGTNLTGGAVNLATGGAEYKAINRSDASAVQLYDGTTRHNRTATSAAVTNAVQAIARFGTGGSINRSNAVFGFYGLGGSFSEAEHNFIRATYLTYRTAIGL